MDILRTMGVDKKKATEGVWIKLDAEEGYDEVEESEIGADAAVKIARADNLQYQRQLTKKLQPVVMRKGRKPIDPEVRQKMEGEALAETVILDWRNLLLGETPFPFSVANVVRVWTDIELIAFKDRLIALINDNELFRLEFEEETVKN